MTTVYWQAGPQETQFINDIAKLYHKELVDAKVTIGILFAYSGKENKPAVKHAGYPAYATIKLVSLKDRITKGYEVELLIDSEYWKESSEARRAALIDHEFSHLMLKKKKKVKKKKTDSDKEDDDQETEIAYDDNNRPVLKLRKGDWNVGDGFQDVVARHGEESIEAESLNRASAFINNIISSVTNEQ